MTGPLFRAKLANWSSSFEDQQEVATTACQERLCMQQEIKQLPGDGCMFNEAAVYFALLLGQLGDALCLVTWSLYHSIVKNFWSWQVTHSMLHHSLLLDSTDT